jgi:hypothetical protein
MSKKEQLALAYVRGLKDNFFSIDELRERGPQKRQIPPAVRYKIEEALNRCIAELEEWRSYWEPIWEASAIADLGRVFAAIRHVKQSMGDNWPLHDFGDE